VQSIYSSYKTDTFGKGFVASKGTVRQAGSKDYGPTKLLLFHLKVRGTAFLAISMVSDLTLFPRSFIIGSFWDTREGSVVPNMSIARKL
jgi:hypothetical protein